MYRKVIFLSVIFGVLIQCGFGDDVRPTSTYPIMDDIYMIPDESPMIDPNVPEAVEIKEDPPKESDSSDPKSVPIEENSPESEVVDTSEGKTNAPKRNEDNKPLQVNGTSPAKVALEKLAMKHKLEKLIAGLKRTLKIGNKLVKNALVDVEKISNKAAKVAAQSQINIAKMILSEAKIELKRLQKHALALEVIDKSDASSAAKKAILDEIKKDMDEGTQEIKDEVVSPIKDTINNVIDAKNKVKDTDAIDQLEKVVDTLKDEIVKNKIKEQIKELKRQYGDCKDNEVRDDNDMKDDIKDEEDNIDDIIDEDVDDEVDDIEDEIEEEEEEENVTDAAGNKSTAAPEDIEDEIDDLEDDVDDIDDTVDEIDEDAKDQQEDEECT